MELFELWSAPSCVAINLHFYGERKVESETQSEQHPWHRCEQQHKSDFGLWGYTVSGSAASCTKANTSCLCYHSGFAWDHIFCIALVIYSTTQHGSDRHPIYKDPRKFWNKWWPAEKKIRKCIFCRNQWKNSHIPRWNRGLRIVIWSFHWYTYLVFFTLLPYLCLYALFTRTNQGGRSRGWETVHVWMCVGAFTVQRSLVCMWWMR